MFGSGLYAVLWLFILVPVAVSLINLWADEVDMEIAYRYALSIAAIAFSSLLVLGCL